MSITENGIEPGTAKKGLQDVVAGVTGDHQAVQIGRDGGGGALTILPAAVTRFLGRGGFQPRPDPSKSAGLH